MDRDNVITYKFAQAGGHGEGVQLLACEVAPAVVEPHLASGMHATSVVPGSKEGEATTSAPAQQQVHCYRKVKEVTAKFAILNEHPV